jgi:hypothetical protein
LPPFRKGEGFERDLRTQNKKRKDDLNSIAFLLSFDLRDYPSASSGFVPFGVPPFDFAQGEIFPGFK